MDREERLHKRRERDWNRHEAESASQKAERLRLRRQGDKDWHDVSKLRKMSEVQLMRHSSETAEEKETRHRQMREAQSERHAGETEEESDARPEQEHASVPLKTRLEEDLLPGSKSTALDESRHTACSMDIVRTSWVSTHSNIIYERGSLLFHACITNTVTALHFLRLAPQCFAFTSGNE